MDLLGIGYFTSGMKTLIICRRFLVVDIHRKVHSYIAILFQLRPVHACGMTGCRFVTDSPINHVYQ